MRAQANYLEWMPVIFISTLVASYGFPLLGLIFNIIMVFARVGFSFGMTRDTTKRGPYFMIFFLFILIQTGLGIASPIMNMVWVYNY